MQEEKGEVVEIKKKCKYDEKFACVKELEAAGCEICLGVQTRDFCNATYINVLAVMKLVQPKKEKLIIDLNKIRGGR